MILRIIKSHKIFNNLTTNPQILEEVNKLHTTYWLTDIQIAQYVEEIKENYPNWNKYQMWREVKYHNILYRLGLFKSHTNYADFEPKQTIKTYIRRIIGNCII